jgi:hypothetical protein
MLALILARHGCHEPQFRWCTDPAQALAAMREETFDCAVLLAGNRNLGACDAPVLLSAAAAAGNIDPLLIVLPQADDDLCGELGAAECEVLISEAGWQSPALPAWIARAMERVHRLCENARLASAEQRRALRERSEASSVLQQQRRFVQADARRSAFEDISLATGAGPQDDSPARDLPPPVAEYYEQLLRSTVMMGTGSLSADVRQLAQLLVLAGLTPRAALRLHIDRVEQLIRGLGARSARHVMTRADMLAMELMIQIGECYRDKSRRTGLGDYGIDLLHERVAQSQPVTVKPRRSGTQA